jgi:hypothetical protein
MGGWEKGILLRIEASEDEGWGCGSVVHWLISIWEMRRSGKAEKWIVVQWFIGRLVEEWMGEWVNYVCNMLFLVISREAQRREI